LQSASRPTVASSRRFLPAQARAKKTPAIESTPISPLGFEARQLAGSKAVPERSQCDPSGNLTIWSTPLSNPLNFPCVFAGCQSAGIKAQEIRKYTRYTYTYMLDSRSIARCGLIYSNLSLLPFEQNGHVMKTWCMVM
jgi:hypothetical protein